MKAQTAESNFRPATIDHPGFDRGAIDRLRSQREAAEIPESYTNDSWFAPEHLARFRMHLQPAFILGNAPTLPVEELHRLDRHFTIGVNRIVQVYDPTLLFYCDPSVWKDIRHLYANSLCQAMVYGEHLPAECWMGKTDGKPFWQIKCGKDVEIADVKMPSSCGEIISAGNSAVGAAAWAIRLGCRPVYLLGMNAEYQGKLTNHPSFKYGFHRAAGYQRGVNPWHDHRRKATEDPEGATIGVIRRKLIGLLSNFPDIVAPIDSVSHLDDVLEEHAKDEKSRQEFIDHLVECASNVVDK